MKKVLLALCAVLMLTTACKKDDNQSPSGNGQGTEQPTNIPTGEGVFNPAQRIVSIMVDGVESEEWIWEDDMLNTIVTEAGETSTFEYNNYRVVTMYSSMEGMPFSVDYTYNGDKLATVAATSGTMNVLNVVFSHNAAGKVSHLTVNVNSMLLGMLSQFFGGGIPDFGFKESPKWSVDNVAINADVTWQGDNVSQVIFNVQLDGNVTLGEVRQMVNIDSLAGSYASLLTFIPDSTLIPLNIDMKDTTVYTYDSHPNPFCGFLGALDLTNFSSNNATSSARSGAATITATLNLGYYQLPFSFPYPISSSSDTFTYTYNAQGFPQTVTNGEGSVTQYSYQQ